MSEYCKEHRIFRIDCNEDSDTDSCVYCTVDRLRAENERLIQTLAESCSEARAEGPYESTTGPCAELMKYERENAILREGLERIADLPTLSAPLSWGIAREALQRAKGMCDCGTLGKEKQVCDICQGTGGKDNDAAKGE